MKRILIIDDDVELCELLADLLTPEGFEVESVHTAEAGLKRALSGSHFLVVLDVMLPGMSGFEVLREIRSETDVPVLMLTAKGEEVDRIVGLEMGADDYLPKPFNPRELLARIRAVGRRTGPARGREGAESPIEVGDVSLDPRSRVVRQAGRVVNLTAAEFALLEALLRMAGTVVAREDLTVRALGRRLSPFDRSIDVHVSSLRRKLGRQAGGAERIRTVRGMGYQYALPDESPPGTGEGA